MFDLYLLRYFLAVVESGSFTRAAERVFVTQPTLSAGIKKLEAQVGQPLFERSSRRVFLTDAGTRFLPRAKAILHECNMAMQAVDDAPVRPVLRIGLLVTLPNRVMGRLLGAFHDANPSVTLEITDGTEQELLNRLDDRSLDYAISIDRGEGTYPALLLKEEAYVFIVARDHGLSGRRHISAADLREERMIVRSRCEVLSETSRYFTDHNVRPRLVYRTGNEGRALAMVAAGVGATVVPEGLVDDRVSSMTLTGFPYRRRLALLRPRYALSPGLETVARCFEDSVKTHLGEGHGTAVP